MRIDMFVYNRCTTDARVLKEAKTLARAGHGVRIVAVLDPTTEAEEERDGFRIVRIDRRPLHYRLLRAMRVASGVGRRSLGSVASRLPEERRGAARAVGALATAPLVALQRLTRRLLLAGHKPLMFFDYYWRAYRLVRADPPQALHAHDLNTLPVAAALAARLHLPLTYDAHELYPEISTLSPREASIWRRLERRLAPRANHTLTVCDSIAAEIERRYEVRRPTVLLNCPVSANGIGGDGMAGPEGGHGALVAHSPSNAPWTDPVVLYQGGFAPHRGLPTLVRAAHNLERGTVMLMGWGGLEEELQALIVRERLEDRVRIVAPVPAEQVVAHAAKASVGVIPYEPVGLNNTYTTPNKLFDYMAAGLPIVGSRLPELVRFIEGDGLGLTFSPGDPVALAAALNEILADGPRYERMRERVQSAAQQYTWERESRKLLALYESSG